jgi:O-antigen/teichoic acid export membrane protein
VIMYIKHHQTLFKWKIDGNLGKKMLKDAWPLILSGMMITIYLKIDQVMLGNLSSIQETGNYAAAVRFSEIFYFLPTIICASVFPAILRAKQISQSFYYNRLQQLYDMMAWLSLIIALTMTLMAVPLLNQLLGQEYASAGQILTWHIWASPFVFLGVARSQWLIAENYARFSFLTTSLGAIVNIGLNFLLIPTYGGQGAAVATIISYLVASHLSCFLYSPMYRTGWMLTKALFIPLRFQQNMSYLKQVIKMRGAL